MLSFPIRLKPGLPIYAQIVEAVKRALATGILQPGTRFPSVRTISRELNVNPNTVQKAIADLTAQGVLEVHPGQGCVLASRPVPPKNVREETLRPLVDHLLIEAAFLGADEQEVISLIQTQRKELQ